MVWVNWENMVNWVNFMNTWSQQQQEEFHESSANRLYKYNFPVCALGYGQKPNGIWNIEIEVVKY